MKKSLVVTLALVFVLGIAGTAFAANPFTDVPANHWAYASVSKLAQAGIIDGYGDGTFVGQRNMTRYEMAQIIAKAMARSDKADAAMNAQIEKLAAEFSNELNGMGVRAARLEKNADNVKITGEVRFGDWNYDGDYIRPAAGSDKDELRSRLWLRGQVNNNWSYTGMLEQTDNLRTNGNADTTTRLRRAWVDGKMGDFGVTAGRFYYKPVYGLVFDEDADGLKVSYGKNNAKLDLFVMRPTYTNFEIAGVGDGDRNQVYGAVLGLGLGKNIDFKAAFYQTEGMNDAISEASSAIYEIALGFNFTKDFGMWAEYLRGDNLNDNGRSGWAVRADYGKMVRSKPGTFNIHAGYYDQPLGTMINTTQELDTGKAIFRDGYKGWKAGVGVMAAKNIDLNIEYYDFDAQHEDYDAKLLWSYVRFYF